MTQSMPLIYIAGPFRGRTPLDVRRNVERMRDVGLIVAAYTGGYPVIPHTMTCDFDKQLTDDFWLDGTMAMLRRCDAILLTSYWARSQGAIAENKVAEQIGLPRFFEVDGYDKLREWVGQWVHKQQVAGV